MRIGGEAPGGGPILSVGIGATSATGSRHLGSSTGSPRCGCQQRACHPRAIAYWSSFDSPLEKTVSSEPVSENSRFLSKPARERAYKKPSQIRSLLRFNDY